MSTRRSITLLFASVAVAVAAAACGGTGASPSPSGAPPSPAGSPPAETPGGSPTGAIDHPTGATDVVLRYDEIGGMMIVEWYHAHVPYFTLYGDGTVVFQRLNNQPPGGPPGQPFAGKPLRIARLAPEQIQQLLEFALRDGGLAAARLRYDNPFIADASTAAFTINVNGTEKTVEAVGLGFDAEPGPDSAIKAAMNGLAEQLRNFDQGGTLASEPYVPERYRGVLFEAGPIEGVAPRPWPWAGFGPDVFALPLDPNVLQTRTRELSPEEVAELGIDGSEGGVQGLYVTGDGVTYSVVVRPLLPDEPVLLGAG